MSGGRALHRPLLAPDEGSETPLAPCPFCGGKAILRRLSEPEYGPFFPFVVSCDGDCPVDVGPVGDDGGAAGAVEAWNRRSPLTAGGCVPVYRRALDRLLSARERCGEDPSLYPHLIRAADLVLDSARIHDTDDAAAANKEGGDQ